jgi:hypothetical protein
MVWNNIQLTFIQNRIRFNLITISKNNNIKIILQKTLIHKIVFVKLTLDVRAMLLQPFFVARPVANVVSPPQSFHSHNSPLIDLF